MVNSLWHVLVFFLGASEDVFMKRLAPQCHDTGCFSSPSSSSLSPSLFFCQPELGGHRGGWVLRGSVPSGVFQTASL